MSQYVLALRQMYYKRVPQVSKLNDGNNALWEISSEGRLRAVL